MASDYHIRLTHQERPLASWYTLVKGTGPYAEYIDSFSTKEDALAMKRELDRRQSQADEENLRRLGIIK